MSKENQAQQTKVPQPQQKVVAHDSAQAEQAPVTAGLADPTQLPGLPSHPTSRAIRQATVLRMQQQGGNAAVQRFLARSNGRNGSSKGTQTATQENGEGAEFLGAGAPTISPAPPPPSPNGNGNGTHHPVNGRAIQREEEGDGDEPTEAEKEAALAAARAAEGQAGQAKDQGLQEIDKSRAAKDAEKQGGDAAKEKANQAKGEAQAAKTGKPGVNGQAPKQPPAAKGAPSETGEALPAAAPPEQGPDYIAPQSAEEDPAFQSVTDNVKKVGDKEKDHVPAKQKADEAQSAAEMPASEQAAHAQNTQAGKIESAEAPPFDKAAFKAKLMQRIQEMAPKNAEEADNLKDSGKMDGMKGEMNNEVGAEKDKTKTPMSEAAAEQPDTGAVPPKPVTPVPGAQPGAPAPDVGAEAAAPKQKGTAEVEAPLQESSQSLDQEMADNEIGEQQLAESNEPEFTGALASKDEAQTNAAEAPGEFRAAEQEHMTTAETEARSTAQDRTQAMHGSREQLLTQVEGNQNTAKSEDEQARQKVAADINRIYEETKTNTEQILDSLEGEVAQVFEAGAEAAKQAFEDLVDRRMEAYKQERYGGWFGWAKWVKDKLAGMPSAVNAFYVEGRTLFLSKMDAVIDNVVEIIARRMAEAKAEIANGKNRIQEYVSQLPEDLQSVGQEAADNVQSKFDQLEESVNSKQGELIDSLASKYQEHLQAVDARIEEMKAANAGLIDKALNAIIGVIKIIMELKDMLLNVLSRIADVVGSIIKAPVKFLGNLIDAIKTGFQQFVDNIGTHLQQGLISWLTGTLGDAGVTLPETFDLPGILELVMQLLGVSFEQIIGKVSDVLGIDLMGIYDQVMGLVNIYQEEGMAGLAKYGLEQLIGAEGVEALMEVVNMFQVMMSGDFGQLWEIIAEHLTDLKEMIFGKIEEFITERVVKAGITWLISLFNPAGAFIRACKMIYDVVMFFIERGSQIVDLVNAIIDSVASIVSGNISGAASYIEQSLAKAIPVAISFLSSLLGLGNISEKVQEIIESVRSAVDNAIDKVLNSGPVQMVAGFISRAISRVQSFVERGVERAGSALGLGGEEAPESAEFAEDTESTEGAEDADSTASAEDITPESENRTPEEKQQALDSGLAEADRLVQDENLEPDQIEARLPDIQSKYQMTYLRLKTEVEGEEKLAIQVEGKVNPKDKKPKHYRSLRELIKYDQPINYKHRNTNWETIGLSKKYHIRINALGFPDFSEYAEASVRIQMNGNRSHREPDGDFGNANEAAGYDRQEKHPGYTWHHHQNRTTMQLIPTELHDVFRHSGGVWAIKNLRTLH